MRLEYSIVLPLDELYQEVILDHYKKQRNRGRIANPDIYGHGVNPLCGDDVEVMIALDGNRIQDFKIEGKGCSISQASLSMMSEALLGKDLKEARKMAEHFKNAMFGREPMKFEAYDDLEALEGVKKFPVRMKCALLPWNTFLDAFKGDRSC